MPQAQLLFKRLSAQAVVPERQTAHSVGYDLVTTESHVLRPGERHTFSTGLAVAIPPDHYGRIAPRSGLAHRSGIDVLAGVIDPDYRGELKVILVNLGQEEVSIEAGSRIAQLIIEACSLPPTREVEELPTPGAHETIRSRQGGFGSTDQDYYFQNRC
jgi:dUTP pyrophosphatase